MDNNRKVILIALLHTSGAVGRMQMLIEGPVGCLSANLAPLFGFELSEDGTRWIRQGTDGQIQAEIDRSRFDKKAVGPVVSWRRAAPGDFPSEHAFRAAWEERGGQIGINAAKARDIHRGHIRAARKPVLDALDADYMQALERDDKTEMVAIAAKKQALRDAPIDPRIDAANSPNELNAAWPAALPPQA